MSTLLAKNALSGPFYDIIIVNTRTPQTRDNTFYINNDHEYFKTVRYHSLLFCMGALKTLHFRLDQTLLFPRP
jgi:hypothetical protein